MSMHTCCKLLGSTGKSNWIPERTYTCASGALELELIGTRKLEKQIFNCIISGYAAIHVNSTFEWERFGAQK